MSRATEAAAVAVASAELSASMFPAVGRVSRMQVVLSPSGSGADPTITGIDLGVTINGEEYPCGWSGAFGAEVTAAGFRSFVGRLVKVEYLGGSLLVDFTVNWST